MSVGVEVVEFEYEFDDDVFIAKQIRVSVGRDSTELDPDQVHNLILELQQALYEVGG